MLLQFITWEVSPTILKLGSIEVRWYGLLWATALTLSYFIFLRYFKRENLTVELLDKLTMYVVLGTIIGARLGHCLFYEPEYYLRNPIDILKIWEGGLASHGAAAGILISLWLFVRKTKHKTVTYWWLLDRISVAVAISGCLIRIGNLMNSEIYGDVTQLPWGFIFSLRGETLPKHPTQLYEALSYLVLFVILFFVYEKRWKTLPQGVLFGFFLVFLFSSRFFIEFIKEPQVNFESSMLLNMGQLLSLPFVIAGIVIMLIRWHKKA